MGKASSKPGPCILLTFDICYGQIKLAFQLHGVIRTLLALEDGLAHVAERDM